MAWVSGAALVPPTPQAGVAGVRFPAAECTCGTHHISLMIAAGQLGQRQAPAAPRVICASRVRPRRVAAAACRSQAQPRRPGNIRAGAGDISQAALDTTHSGGHKISAAGSDMARVAVVTTLGCPYCKKAKAALQVCSPRAPLTGHPPAWAVLLAATPPPLPPGGALRPPPTHVANGSAGGGVRL